MHHPPGHLSDERTFTEKEALFEGRGSAELQDSVHANPVPGQSSEATTSPLGGPLPCTNPGPPLLPLTSLIHSTHIHQAPLCATTWPLVSLLSSEFLGHPLLSQFVRQSWGRSDHPGVAWPTHTPMALFPQTQCRLPSQGDHLLCARHCVSQFINASHAPHPFTCRVRLGNVERVVPGHTADRRPCQGLPLSPNHICLCRLPCGRLGLW